MTAYYRTKGTPMFQLIYENLKRDIESGDYAPGAQLPSESELCRAYGVQRDTARRALQLLVRDGLIFKRPGRGSYVNDGQKRLSITVDPVHLNNPIVSYLLSNSDSQLLPRRLSRKQSLPRSARPDSTELW